jgi:molybdate transport system ATP-binding protein
VFDATLLERQERAGTMRCRLEGAPTELEVPLTNQRVGDRISVAIRAGDILLAAQEPHGISARNVLRGRLIETAAQGPAVVATIDAGARFLVHLTPGGADAVRLRARDGDGELWLIIKTYSCRVLAE